MQRIGQREPARHQRQRDQHLHLIVVNALQHPVGNGPQRETEHRAPHHLLDEQQRDPAGRHRVAAQYHLDQHQKHHHRDPVVEQRLARDLRLQALGHARALQDGEHRDGSVGEISAPNSRQ
jgi:hypothetical protein